MKNHYKFWIVLSFLLIFTAGVFSGVLLDKHVLNKKTTRPDRRDSSRRPTRFPTFQAMAAELQLSSEQKTQFQEIFNSNEERLHTMGQEIHKRSRDMRIQFLQELKSVLDAEQTKKFDAMIDKYLDQRKAEYERRKQRQKNSPPKKGAEK